MAEMEERELYLRMEQWVKGQFEEVSIKATRNVGKTEERMLPMRDGTCLKTVIRFPEPVEEGEQFPTVLVRSCYPGQEVILRIRAEEFVKRGFGFVYQWCRGTGGSQGEWEPNVNERDDGLDTVNWLARQPIVKNIGYWGDSYLALTGWCMASAVPEKVKTMCLGVYGVDRHVSAYQDGLFRMDVLTSWARENAGTAIAADNETSYLFRPQKDVDEKLWGVHLDWYRDWVSNPEREADYWKQGFWGMLKGIPQKVRIPILIREGWYDHHLGSALISYGQLSEETRRHSVLQIGPWNHNYMAVIPEEKISQLKDDSASAPLEWFYRILVKGEIPEGGIKEYVIGEDRWVEKKDMRDSAGKIFYLCADGSLNERAEKNGKRTYCYDPENPVRSHGGESLLADMKENGSFLQPGPDYRKDVISFVSDVLDKKLLVEGRIKVKLFVSSDAEDTAFTAKIMEVFPDGKTVNVRGSITTLAFRNGSDRRQEYIPGEIVEICIQMWDIAWCFREGSRVRVDISSSDFPQYAVHTNYPGLWSLQDKTKKAVQAVYTGLQYPSAVILPI